MKENARGVGIGSCAPASKFALQQNASMTQNSPLASLLEMGWVCSAQKQTNASVVSGFLKRHSKEHPPICVAGELPEYITTADYAEPGPSGVTNGRHFA
jgi:hypothetical protein